MLADFRERLAQDDRADRLLDLALGRLKEAGLVRERTTQRTDPARVLAAVRDLTRLELVAEAVPAELEEVARTASRLLTEVRLGVGVLAAVPVTAAGQSSRCQLR